MDLVASPREGVPPPGVLELGTDRVETLEEMLSAFGSLDDADRSRFRACAAAGCAVEISGGGSGAPSESVASAQRPLVAPEVMQRVAPRAQRRVDEPAVSAVGASGEEDSDFEEVDLSTTRCAAVSTGILFAATVSGRGSGGEEKDGNSAGCSSAAPRPSAVQFDNFVDVTDEDEAEDVRPMSELRARDDDDDDESPIRSAADDFAAVSALHSPDMENGEASMATVIGNCDHAPRALTAREQDRREALRVAFEKEVEQAFAEQAAAGHPEDQPGDQWSEPIERFALDGEFDYEHAVAHAVKPQNPFDV